MRKNGKYPQIADVKSDSTLTYTVKNLPNATRENFKVRAYKTVKGKKVYGAYSDNWTPPRTHSLQRVLKYQAFPITA